MINNDCVREFGKEMSMQCSNSDEKRHTVFQPEKNFCDQVAQCQTVWTNTYGDVDPIMERRRLEKEEKAKARKEKKKAKREKKKAAKAKSVFGGWLAAVAKARKALNIKGFSVIKKGTPLYKKAKELYQ